jgi:hypothetical protein
MIYGCDFIKKQAEFKLEAFLECKGKVNYFESLGPRRM